MHTPYSLTREQGDPAAEDPWLQYRAITPFSSDPACFRLISNWQSHCEQEHEACAEVELPLLPTRVLEVNSSGDTPTVRLCSMKLVRASYAALSYCWGACGANFFTTTASSIERLMKGVAVTVLPETVQDAVSVTTALGLHYLWVDCLCIVQDAVEDWTAALADMDTIYGNSTITIAASSSPGAHAGFLKSRPFTGPCLKLPFQSPFMAEQGLLWIQRRDRLTVQQRLSDHWKQPLQKRAWLYRSVF
jgi:hypothetical protein